MIESVLSHVGPGVSNAINPYCVVVTLSMKPPQEVWVKGGIEGELIITQHHNADDDVKSQQTTYAVGAPVTALIVIENSPLVVVGSLNGCVECIHISRDATSTCPNSLIVTSLMKIHASPHSVVTQICYQKSTKKLAFLTKSTSDNNCQVSIACLEPNNMKVIGQFSSANVIDTLLWDSNDFKLFAGHGSSISCYNVIGMTFQNDAEVECLWTRDAGIACFREMRLNSAGNIIYAIDGKRRGFYTIALLNAADSNEKLPTMHYQGDIDCSASSCLLLDDSAGEIIVGSVSGEISICQFSNKSEWEIIASLSCAVTSVLVTSFGFCSIGMDGSVMEHRRTPVRNERLETSCMQWDFLLKDETRFTQSKSASNADICENILFREEYKGPTKEPNQDFTNVQQVDADMIAAIKTNIQPPSEHQDTILVYPIHETPCTDLSSILTEHEMQSLIDIHTAESRLSSEFNVTSLPRKVFVSATLGDTALRELKDSDEFLVVDSKVILSKKEANAKLKNEITNSVDTIRELSSEIKLLKWTQELLELQINDAVEETKDWQLLRVSNHLRQLVDGKAISEEKALTNSLDKLSVAEDFQKSQLKSYAQEAERLANQIKNTEAENQLLKSQIKDAKEKIAQSEEDLKIRCGIKSNEDQQKDKMNQLMKRRRLANEVQSQARTIAELRSQLKALRARTFPQFD